jgi:hypothetical protein
MKAESRAEVSHHMTDCSRISPFFSVFRDATYIMDALVCIVSAAIKFSAVTPLASQEIQRCLALNYVSFNVDSEPSA